jgi:hypothetical protein
MSSARRSTMSERPGGGRPRSPLRLPGAAAAPVADGLLPVRALVVDENEDPTGMIGVWVDSGFLRQLDLQLGHR